MLETSDDSLASVPAINQYLKSAQACGVDYFPLLERAGIDAEILADNNKHISAAAMEHLLELLLLVVLLMRFTLQSLTTRDISLEQLTHI